ncbi:MAG: hypothetical protein NC089_13020, partial [Bacteroides sp.]|nr:hypothetical protein [Bacteroides sp.]
MATINIVLEGKYKGEKIKGFSDSLYLPNIDYGYYMTKNHVSSYQVLDEKNPNSSEFSFWKGALGVAVFGAIGAVAGIGGKKSSKEYLISIEWKSGEKS